MSPGGCVELMPQCVQRSARHHWRARASLRRPVKSQSAGYAVRVDTTTTDRAPRFEEGARVDGHCFTDHRKWKARLQKLMHGHCACIDERTST